MKKVLFSATVDGHIMNFHIPYLKWFKEQGYEVHVASNGDSEIPFVDRKYNVPYERLPFKRSNISAYKQLKEIIDANKYDIIHCHTPVGGVLTRLAARKSRLNGTKVLYTAHGFHFFKGAVYRKWLIYYPIEKWLSKYTDCLITINKEDYNIAVNNKFKVASIKLVNGVGIDLNRFKLQTEERKKELRDKYGYRNEAFILVYAGELSYRKHQDLLINVVKKIKNKIPNLKLLLAGTGDLLEQYRKQIKNLDIEENVELLGYRKDVDNLMMLSDVAVSSSRQEGLPVNIMEAMATGLPLVVSNCRGNRDLVNHGVNGYTVGMNNEEVFARCIERLYKSEDLRNEFGIKSFENIQEYSLENIIDEMEKVYLEQMV